MSEPINESNDRRPPAGAYENIPTADYVGWQHPSSGSPWLLRKRTLRAVKLDILGGPREDNSAARFLGDVVHGAILEPETFEERYLCLPTPDPDKHRTQDNKPSKNPASTDAYKSEVKALATANPGRRLVDAGEYAKGIEMRDHVFGHPEIKTILKSPGRCECSFVVTDPLFGVNWKLRPDKLVETVEANVSVKTTRNARPDVFTHDFFKFGYHVKEAVYRMLLPHAGIPIRNSWMIVIESEGAREVMLYNIPEVYLDLGERLALKYMERIARAIDTMKWPGLPGGLVDLFPPDYAFDRVEAELANADTFVNIDGGIDEEATETEEVPA